MGVLVYMVSLGYKKEKPKTVEKPETVINPKTTESFVGIPSAS
jgi:hypothetical protein